MAETKIDCQLLVDIMTAEDGIFEDDQIEIGGTKFSFIKGKSGVTIQVCMSVEYVTNRTAKDWMRQLGIDYLIVSLFPPDQDLPALDGEKQMASAHEKKDEDTNG